MEFINVTNSSPGRLHTMLDFGRKAFLEYVYNHRNEELYIIIPPKGDIENYVFNLEITISNIFGVSIINNKFHYILGNKLLDEIPTFTDYVVMDPLCYLQENTRLYDIILEIKEKVDKL